jgi:hypothetical protein
MVALHLAIALIAAMLALRLLPGIRSHLLILCLIVAIGILHGAAPALTPPGKRSMDAMESSRLLAAWFSLGGLLALVAGYELHFRCYRSHERLRDEQDAPFAPASAAVMERYFWISIVLGLVGAFLYVRSAGVGFLEYGRASRFEFRNFQNTLLMWPGQYLFHISFAPGFLGQFLSHRYRVLGTFHAVLSMLLAFFYLFQGTRHVALGIIGGLLFGYIYSRQLNTRRLLQIAVGGALMMLTAVTLYQARQGLADMSFGEAITRAFSPESLQEPLTRDPLNYHEHFIGAVEFFPHEHPYLYGASYRRMLAFFLPGSDFPVLKPEHAARVFANVVYGDIYDADFRATHPPSLLGDAYINFWGWPGIVALFLNGAAISWVSAKIRTSLLWFLGVGPHLAWFCILLPRGDNYDCFVMGLILLIVTAGLLFGRQSRAVVSAPSPNGSPAAPNFKNQARLPAIR